MLRVGKGADGGAKRPFKIGNGVIKNGSYFKSNGVDVKSRQIKSSALGLIYTQQFRFVRERKKKRRRKLDKYPSFFFSSRSPFCRFISFKLLLAAAKICFSFCAELETVLELVCRNHILARLAHIEWKSYRGLFSIFIPRPRIALLRKIRWGKFDLLGEK